jgi:hypothetical protein
MSIKPKYSSGDSGADKRHESTFLIWDEKDDQIAIEATQNPEEVVWPRQILRIVGPTQVSPPGTLMTAREFASWRESLDAAGFDFDLRFK